MSTDYMHLARAAGGVYARGERILVGLQPGVANAAGGGAGAAVTTAVTFQGAATPGGTPSVGDLPAAYTVVVNPGQDATWYVSAKTASGFNVTLTPRLASATLAAGAFDVAVFA